MTCEAFLSPARKQASSKLGAMACGAALAMASGQAFFLCIIHRLMHLQVECMLLTCMDCRAHASWQPSLAARMAATRTALRRLRSSLAVDGFKTDACLKTAVRRACLWARGARIARTRVAHGRLRERSMSSFIERAALGWVGAIRSLCGRGARGLTRSAI